MLIVEGGAQTPDEGEDEGDLVVFLLFVEGGRVVFESVIGLHETLHQVAEGSHQLQVGSLDGFFEEVAQLGEEIVHRVDEHGEHVIVVFLDKKGTVLKFLAIQVCT